MTAKIQRICRRCGMPKPPGRCRPCREKQRTAWRSQNRKKRNATERAWRRQNPGSIKKTQTKWAERNPELKKTYARKSSLKYNYGMTLDEYDAMLIKQGGVCALCGKPPTEKRLAVDHDHATNEVRGLLHNMCNLLLGTAQDDPRLLHAGIRYLAVHGRTL
jgi:hypothetical protein